MKDDRTNEWLETSRRCQEKSEREREMKIWEGNASDNEREIKRAGMGE